MLVSKEIVGDIARAFAADWERSTGEALENHWVASPASPSFDKAEARLILDGPNEDNDKLNDVLLGVFSSAKERLWLITPYFLPDKDLVGALTAARLRGVDADDTHRYRLSFKSGIDMNQLPAATKM